MALHTQATINTGGGVVDLTSSGDDDSSYEHEPEVILSPLGNKPITINFSVRANYTTWAPREAFRELVQNWRDGIIRAFGLAERDFKVLREEKIRGRDTEIVYRVALPNSDPPDWLGYIYFKARDGMGSIDITNRGASLEPWHLDFGGTSKANIQDQAGTHGEGLKVALLVLMRGRQNHTVRCCSSAFNWRFNFTDRGRLVVRLSPMTSESIRRAQDQAQRRTDTTLLPFAARPGADVQLMIGEARNGRTEAGEKTRRVPVSREEFETWTKAALFLQSDVQDDGIIRTDWGSLLTDARLCGNIYLKDLLLRESTPSRSASITNKPLKFGYSFSFGQTNRERQSVAGANEESKAILTIWAGVLAAKPQLVQQLSDMLNTDEPKYADVSIAKRNMTVEMASKLKDFLFEASGKWYYTAKEKSKNSRFDQIIEGLGYEGIELTEDYWSILERDNLVRTAQEEEHRRFMAADVAETPPTSFATSITRLLRACLRACPQTNHKAIKFVKAGQLHLHIFYSEPEALFSIHERWLTSAGAIQELGLAEDLIESDILFHAVKGLFADALEQLPRDQFQDEDDSRTGEWRRKLEISRSEQRLLNYLRIRDLVATPSVGLPSIQVAWPVDPRWNQEATVEIQCHNVSHCTSGRDDLLVAEDALWPKMSCQVSEDMAAELTGSNGQSTCWAATVPLSGGKYSAENLEEDQLYFFVLLAPSDRGSFVAQTEPRRTDRRAGPLRSTTLPALASPREQGVVKAESTDVSMNLTPAGRRSRAAPVNSSESDDEHHEYDPGRDNAGDDIAPSSRPIASPDQRGSGVPVGPVAQTPIAEMSVAGRQNGAGREAAMSFALGAQLQTLDIFSIDKDQWYEGVGTGDVKAVIGIVRGEASPRESRKRRRTGV